MDTKEQLVTLGELSNLEKKLRTANRTLEERPLDARKAEEAAEAAKTSFDVVDRLRHAAEKDRRRFESEVAAERDKLKKWVNRADSIRGEREHAALHSEIGALKRSIGYLENQQLEKMQELEETEGDAEKKGKLSEELAVSSKKEWAAVEGELNIIREEIAGIERGRDALLEKLPKNLTAKYVKLAERRHGVAIAVIVGPACTGCRCELPPNVVLQVHKGELIQTCSICQRFLVHESMTRAPDVTAE
ncbi:MAG: hypothetical protein GY822_14635 [Deltaproteobacteria bacterium]|nr:hypothetical protein [Deltaproteobacteria bacterium]